MSDYTDKDQTTHFGYQEVPWQDKTKLVNDVFDNVATRYDLMNDLMSLTLHRFWKWFSILSSSIHKGERVLDLAGGSGDLSRKIAQRVGKTGQVILADLNGSMIQVGRDRMIDSGLIEIVRFVQANAESLPFKENYFDCITIGFGLRNVRDKLTALSSMFRVLKPGGRLIVLEFSHPVIPGLKSIYDAYSFYLLPLVGQIITGHPESYHYLVESIRMHPNQEQLKQMIHQAGFEDCIYHNLSGGIVAVHKAYKY